MQINSTTAGDPGTTPAAESPSIPSPPTSAASLDGGPPVPLGVGSLVEALSRSVEHSPGLRFTAVRSGGVATRTGAEFMQRARQIAGALRHIGVEAGHSVLLQLDDQIDVIESVWGSLLAGATAVPLPMVDVAERQSAACSRLRRAWRASTRPLLLTSKGNYTGLHALCEAIHLPKLRIAAAEDLDTSTPIDRLPAPALDDQALLLMTSGSTGEPRGIPLTHRNVLASIAASVHVNELDEREVSLNWLHLHHVGALMRSLREVYLGCHQIQVEPGLILDDPLRWLDQMTEHAVTTTWSPNFGFAALLDALRRGAPRRWELSSLRSLWTSGEPVNPTTVIELLDRLAPYGLDEAAMQTAWGMTEACFATRCPDYAAVLRAGPERLPPVGAPVPGLAMRIVNDAGAPVPARMSGHLQIRGALVTDGFAHDRRLFTDDGWFDTGDLGRIEDGVLTITGRTKDIIIINGDNHSGPELEALVGSLAGVDSCFAVGVRPEHANTESLALFVVPDGEREVEATAEDIRRVVAHNFSLPVGAVVAVERSQLPTTSSGKVSRAELSRALLRGTFDPQLVGSPGAGADEAEPEPGPASALRGRLEDIWAAVLKTRDFGPKDVFFDIGGHSLLAIQVIARVGRMLGVELTQQEFFAYPTITALEGLLSDKLDAASGESA